jgi:hypothetical protein
LKRIKRELGRIYNLLKIYYALIFSLEIFKSKNNKTIILCFDGHVHHGGLLDRIKGIISFYEVSKQLNYDFKIYFNSPFQLTDFLIPNKVNWVLEKRYFHVFSTKIFYLMNQFNKKPIDLILKSKATTFYIYCNVDYLKKIYPEKDTESLEAIFRNSYNELFLPSERLNKAIDSNPSHKNIAVHTRFTTLLGDFIDSTQIVLDYDRKKELIQKNLKELNQIQSNHLNETIYVLSDSISFLNYIKQNTEFKILEGIPKHMDDKLNEFEFESHLKTFTDFYFLINSKAIYSLRIGKMYPSGYSKYAAIIGNNPFHIVQE